MRWTIILAGLSYHTPGQTARGKLPLQT